MFTKESKIIVIKVDVDTERGTRMGVPNLLDLFRREGIPATFLFSLGPDNTGRAIRRVFQSGFLSKISRTNVVSIYGIRTLLNGLCWPGPFIARRCQAVMLQTQEEGHEVGIHCYDHSRWQDGLHKWTKEQVVKEFQKAREEFERVFSRPAKTAGAAGWQANAYSLEAYDAAGLVYASDTRGAFPCFPMVGEVTYKTLQIPTNLPTLDELIGYTEFSLATIADYYLSLLRKEVVNVLTVHAEIEGMKYLHFFDQFLSKMRQEKIRFQKMQILAERILKKPHLIPRLHLKQAYVKGRSGRVAVL